MTSGEYSKIVKSNIRVLKPFIIQLTGVTTLTKFYLIFFAPVLSRNNMVCTKLKLGSSAQLNKETSLLEFICVKTTF